MSYNNSPTLVLDIAAGRRDLYSSVALTICALFLVSASYLGLLRIAAFNAVLIPLLLVGVASVWFWNAAFKRPANTISRLTWQQEGNWLLQMSDGESVEAKLLPTSWVTSRIWCLRFQSVNRKLPAIIVWRSQYSDLLWQSWLMRLNLHARNGPLV